MLTLLAADLQNSLSELEQSKTSVTDCAGHLGYTSCPAWAGSDASEGVFGGGRKVAVCCSPTGGAILRWPYLHVYHTGAYVEVPVAGPCPGPGIRIEGHAARCASADLEADSRRRPSHPGRIPRSPSGGHRLDGLALHQFAIAGRYYIPANREDEDESAIRQAEAVCLAGRSSR